MRRRGFTLIELLVALFITAIMFAIGYGALDQALRNRAEITDQAARLVAVQRAMRALEQDFELLQPRPVRNAVGDGYQAALVSAAAAAGGATGAATASAGLPIVSLTRGGWSNPAGVARSELQRVSYLLRDHHLVREHWAALDPVAGAEPLQRDLLDRVESLSLRYMDAGHQWQTFWPPSGSSPTDLRTLRRRPVAVEITLVLQDWGPLVRIVEVAG
jgi:general secretion pathway protein J